MNEKRKSHRTPDKIKSEIHADNRMTFSTIRDMSRGGIYVSTPEPLETGSEISLSLYLPGQDPLDLKGIVRWNTGNETPGRRCGMGIEFTGAEMGDLQKIEAIMK